MLIENADQHVESRNITVVGTGYVGLVTALFFAEYGHHVTCLDTNQEKINRLKKGEPVLYEPQVPELLARHYKRMRFTSQPKKALAGAEVVVLAVGTPERSDGSANLSFLYEAAKEIGRWAAPKTAVLVKSTVPVGTGDQLVEFFNEHAPHLSLHVVSNPEFLAQGTAIRDTFAPERIVIGLSEAMLTGGAESVPSDKAHLERLLHDLYGRSRMPIVTTNRRSAELIKYASNNFLALKISYINEMANLCEIVGANVEDVALGIGLDSRIGSKFLRAGTGYGGSCFPKDTKALHWLANFNDYEIKTVKAAIEVNENQKLKLIKKVRALLGSLKKKRIAVFGVTFKPDTDDLRESPALPCIALLLEEGARVAVYDPRGLDHLKRIFGKQIDYCKQPEKALREAEACLIFTEWPEITNFDLKKYARLMKRPLVLDGRNCYRLEQAAAYEIEYVSVGRPSIHCTKSGTSDML